MPTAPITIDSGTAHLETHPPAGVTLFVNGVPSSHLDFDSPGFLAFEYFQQMDAVLAATHQGPVKALHLGAGGCALARAWDHSRPGSRQIAVDIDARLVTLVREWFDLPRAPALRLRAQDALSAVHDGRPDWFDVVVRDVFSPDTTPPELSTPEFAARVAQILKPDGLYLANCADRPPLALARAEIAALRSAFRHVAMVAEVGILAGKRFGNVVLAATNARGNPFDDAALARALRSLPMPARIELKGENLT